LPTGHRSSIAFIISSAHRTASATALVHAGTEYHLRLVFATVILWSMSAKARACETPEIEHVRRFVAYAKLRVNKARYYPPLNAYRYTVAMALYSKCLTAAEATMALLDAGFSDEAFGMTRTLVDIYITLRYITNKDIEQRARLYYRFVAKDIQGLNDIAKDYWPQLLRPMDPRIIKEASRYPNPHRWSGKSARDMALEPDTFEPDPKTGKPMVHDFPYRVVYRQTSHFVHPTIVALKNHVVQPGRDNFVVRGMNVEDLAHVAVFNVAAYVGMTMVSFYRCMGDPQPDRVGKWSGALTAHLVRRHK
jgi:hypothetical protein